ncbi:CLUMA_CG016051, isoform A [Clunio marinus]|uniref:CLUMA_CG016051, isoform A n=1 Tax=Clunio marinus TaxID=568069 RepID=A0A1J1IRQ7_9DIPT|nr:CLUMA_CG016051, isoform A [Clunio marinus]
MKQEKALNVYLMFARVKKLKSDLIWSNLICAKLVRKFVSVFGNFAKVLSRVVNARPSRRNDGYIAANTTLTNDGGAQVDDVFLQSSDDLDNSKMSLPPRYRLRDLLLGDFAFTDDGQR